MSTPEGESVGETLEEAGALEADVGANLRDLRQLATYVGNECLAMPLPPGPGRRGLPKKCWLDVVKGDARANELTTWNATNDQQLANIDPKLKIEMDPYAHRHLRPEMMLIREELRLAKSQTLAVRRTALKNLLLNDFMTEDCELRNIGLAYAPTDP